MIVELFITLPDLYHHLVKIFVELTDLVFAVVFQIVLKRLMHRDLFHRFSELGNWAGYLALHTESDNVSNNDGEYGYQQRRHNIKADLAVQGFETGSNADGADRAPLKKNGLPEIKVVITVDQHGFGRGGKL